MAGSRRGVGLSAFTNAALNNAYQAHGTNLRQTHLDSLQTQLGVFQQLLHQFSIEHAKDIRSNPTFRAEFARMCNAIGVDPLASSHTGREKGKGDGGSFWSQILGGSISDLYFEIAVRIVEVCRDTKAENGGLMAVSEVKARIQKGRGIGGGMEASDDDIRRAVESLKPLGSGFRIIDIGTKAMVRSVPKELNTDQATVLEAIQIMGFVTVSMLQANLMWEKVRAATIIEDLVADSLVWVDNQGRETEYWSPTFIRLDGSVT